MDSGRKVLQKRGCVAIKIHGSSYARKGEPDVVGCWNGIAFAIEVKVPGEQPTKIQLKRLMEWAIAGARVGVATCDKDFVDIAIFGKRVGL